jgi:hypothetical protein
MGMEPILNRNSIIQKRKKEKKRQKKRVYNSLLGKNSEILAQTFSLPLSKTSEMEFLAPNEMVQKE